MPVNKNRNPYFDDYNAEKGYHEVLFVPRRAVQTRELNQLQTMFYEQISRFGDHMFEEGSIVIPGETSYDLSYSYVKVDISNLENVKGRLSGSGIKVTGNRSGIEAELIQYAAPEGSDPATFYVKYLKGGNDAKQQLFTTGEGVNITNRNGDQFAAARVLETGTGSKFTVAAGVYYLGGRFVLVDEQTILLDKYGTKPSFAVGFLHDETAVTVTEDSDLYDNAQGSPNFTAPGADRMRIDLKLEKVSIEELDNAPDNFVEIFRISNGSPLKKARGPEYNVIEHTFARRTYDESGDYTVEPFKIQVREHLRENGNDGAYTAEQGGDESKYVISVSPGKAYVRGYEQENLSTKNLTVDKARDSGRVNNASVAARMGYYILVSGINNVPDTGTFQTINLNDGSGNKIGSARIKFFQKDGEKYRLYLFDVRNNANELNTTFVKNVRAVESYGGMPFDANVSAEDAVLRGTEYNTMLYKLPVELVRTLLDETGQSDTSFTTVKQYNTYVATNGTVVLTASNNETFLTQDPQYCLASFTEGMGQMIDVSSAVSLGGSPLGKTATINIGAEHASKAIRVNMLVSKQQAVHRSKAVTEQTIVEAVQNGRLSLRKSDAFELVSVIDDQDNDVTDMFTLNHNKRPTYYDVSYLSCDPNITVMNPVTVTFKYFEHSTGDYFSVDSYSGIEYRDIPVEGDGIYLTDYLDFRPRIDEVGSTFTGSGSNVGNLPVPYSVIRSDVEYYMPRRDKLYMKSNGQFGVKTGVSALDPKVPEDPVDSLALYVLEVPAYTMEIDDVRAREVATQRYTMEDIARLESRIENIEYYVSLNLLEKEAADMQIIDPDTGLNRFKNGFLVDNFVNHAIGDYGWPDYHCAIGEEDLRPEFSLNAVDMVDDLSNSYGIVIKSGMCMLEYDEVEYLHQPLRTDSINVNPYAVFRWAGDLELIPSVDNWVDTVYTQPSVTYRTINNGNLTQTWTSNSLSWTEGTETSSSSSRVTVEDRPHGDRRNRLSGSDDFHEGARADVVTTRTTRVSTNIDSTTRQVSSNVIPFMRHREVEVIGKGHKPLTELNFFFDGVMVNQYMRPQNRSSWGTPVVTDEDGNFTAMYNLPNNGTHRFTVGTKKMVAIDSEELDREAALSYGEADYTASGTRNVRQRTIVATRRTTTSTSESIENLVTWYDPLAQSFLVEQDGGAFVTKIQTYFRTKDDVTPINLDIREMENGQPTQRIVPGSKVTLLPSEVPVSDDGSEPTTFEFGYPVYLQEGVEYCFVLWANSNNYRAWYARMGEKDLGTGKYVAKQPYMGVMFKSQNSSTWTEDQMADLQFKIHKAQFNGGQGRLNVHNDDLDVIELNGHPLTTTANSSVLRIKREMHNYVQGTHIEISGAEGGNGLNAGDINGAYVISNIVDFDHFEIDLARQATATGRIGGDNITLSHTIQASFLRLNTTDINFPDTDINYRATGMTGKSMDGDERPYIQSDVWANLENEARTDLPAPWMITNRNDEAQNFGDQRSLRCEVGMMTTNPNVSPVIDMQSFNIVTPYYMIDGNLLEKQADGSNAHAKYRTRISGLKEAANSIKVFLDVQNNNDSEVVLSGRFGNSEEEVKDAEWQIIPTRMENEMPSGEFGELEFGIDEGDGLSEYTYFQVMIQMKSTSNCNIPVCQKLRVLALGT